MAKKTNNKATQKHSAQRSRTTQAWPSSQQMAESYESLEQMLDKVTQAKSEGATLTTEQRLLDALFQPDAPDGPGETNSHCQTISLLDVLEDGGKKYKLGTKITVGDLAKHGRDYACRILSSLTNAKVSDDGHCFSWSPSEKYAPSIRFAVSESKIIPYDDCGDLLSPADYADAGLILPILAFETNGRNDEAYVIWGNYSKTETTPYFLLESAETAHDILLIVPWGGATSQTRGNSCTDALQMHGINYFDKTISKRGGKGCDFYVIGIGEDMRQNVIATEHQLTGINTNSMIIFDAKLRTIQRLDHEYADYNNRIDRCIWSKLENLMARFQTNEFSPYTEDDLVPCPVDFSIGKPQYNLHSSIEELESCEIPEEKWYELRTIVAKTTIKLEAWESFAPRYMALMPVITKCHGWINLYEDSVLVTLPNRDPKSEELTTTRRFAFSEEHLHQYIELIMDFWKMEKIQAEKNDQNLAEIKSREDLKEFFTDLSGSPETERK